MSAESLFTQLPCEQGMSVIEFDGQRLSVPVGVSLAAALLHSGVRSCRRTPVSGSSRAPYCLMGVCFECLVEVDGVPNCQACLITVRNGMRVMSQHGARAVAPCATSGGRFDAC
ncbi:(2Fe-2S)-binding protein [Pseudomonas sp. H9]|uniref:(2Fe-2S)-binding protein n=1 Tax=Pseudomonas sp. H9 TaxID=483968 RepID=UPI00105827F1|nr:(2Fe-2S)-binding protein [Pseudomonas sp. H9]TDF86206.1 (2Fe-2S)-binding protein [Pseudomonas sp. H9]